MWGAEAGESSAHPAAQKASDGARALAWQPPPWTEVAAFKWEEVFPISVLTYEDAFRRLHGDLVNAEVDYSTFLIQGNGLALVTPRKLSTQDDDTYGHSLIITITDTRPETAMKTPARLSGVGSDGSLPAEVARVEPKKKTAMVHVFFYEHVYRKCEHTFVLSQSPVTPMVAYLNKIGMGYLAPKG